MNYMYVKLEKLLSLSSNPSLIYEIELIIPEIIK